MYKNRVHLYEVPMDYFGFGPSADMERRENIEVEEVVTSERMHSRGNNEKGMWWWWLA